MGLKADAWTSQDVSQSHPVACVGFSLGAPVSSSGLTTCTWGRVESQSPSASCDDWWPSRVHFCWNLSLNVLKVPVRITFVLCFLFFLRLLFFYSDKTLSWRSMRIYIYLQCAQARRERLSFILFLSRIAHTPVTETWYTRHFNV